MQRRDFIKRAVAIGVAAEIGSGKAQAKVAAHNWGNYDFGSGPRVADRLNQGPFPQYPPDALIPTDDVVMTTTPSEEVVPNYGMGLVTYITADSGTEEIKSDNIPQAIEDLVRFPLGQQLYIRPTWREVQPQPGRLELPDYVKLVLDQAKKNNKRVGLRIHLLLCKWCRRYGKQINLLHTAAHDHPEQLTEPVPQKLSAEARERIKKRVQTEGAQMEFSDLVFACHAIAALVLAEHDLAIRLSNDSL